MIVDCAIELTSLSIVFEEWAWEIFDSVTSAWPGSRNGEV